MGRIPISELHNFRRFLDEKLNSGNAELLPEEALDEWRQLHPNPEAFEEDAAAIHESLDDLANGDKGIPFSEFDEPFRKEHNLSAKPSADFAD